MLVTVNDVRVVGPGQQEFGEIYVTTKPTRRGRLGVAPTSKYAETPTGRLLILPVNRQVPAANVGDVLSGATTGPVDWSTFGGYAVAATTVGSASTTTSSRPRRPRRPTTSWPSRPTTSRTSTPPTPPTSSRGWPKVS